MDASCICTAPAPEAPPSSWNPVTEEAPLTGDGLRRQSPATAESASTTARVEGGATPPKVRQDAVQIAADLNTLLDRAHVPGPYVLAGHSFGGLYTLTFAARYPDRVAGMVLLDSTAPRPGPAPATTGESFGVLGRFMAVAPAVAHLGVTRLIAQIDGGLPPRSEAEARANASTAHHLDSYIEEFLQGSTSMQQAAALTDLSDKPLIVLTADTGNDEAWRSAQDHLATLSTNSRHRVAKATTHGSMIADEADAGAATQAIRDVVAAVRSSQPLPSR